MAIWSVWVPCLPWRNLSSNAGARSRRAPWGIAESRGRLKNEVLEAIKTQGDLRRLESATAAITFRLAAKRPKMRECPRCTTLGTDYPNWAVPADHSQALPCVCYRPEDVGNLGGDPLKPILDALVWMEILPDDDWRHLPSVTLRIERVDSLDAEGILVELLAATEPPA
mgnify:CR=1 FL=1